MRELVWQPTTKDIEQSNINTYRKWLNKELNLELPLDYEILWQWSVDNKDAFWQSIWEYFEVESPTPYSFVSKGDQIYNTQWFGGSKINYTYQVFRDKPTDGLAIQAFNELGKETTFTWTELSQKVRGAQQYLKQKGLSKGDVVCAFMPNIPETTIFFLACASLGIIWSSCSPDFGKDSVVSRFGQLNPKLLLAVDGYTYNGKKFDKIHTVQAVCEVVSSIEHVILVDYIDSANTISGTKVDAWKTHIFAVDEVLEYEMVPFEHPIWVLYSSGTTGNPKAITHSQGGVLLEQLKYLAFNADVKAGEKLFWFTTTGWMMWNYTQGALLLGATLVCYEGSPSYPNLGVLWQMAAKTNLNHFGTSAPFLVACLKKGLTIGKDYDLHALRSIGSTGSPLPPEAYDYVYQHIKSDIWLCSISGGTDVCTAFVGGAPLKPIYKKEIQARSLGCDMASFNDNQEPILNEVGEMVVRQAMPSMPIYFWNDDNKARYKSSYFEHFENIWRHGDWLEIKTDGAMVIYGRSDATLNRHGIRIGTAEIYNGISHITNIVDSIVVNIELEDGDHYMPLFVKLKPESKLDDALKKEIAKSLRTSYSPRHVPDEVIQVDSIPVTISGKKLEAPIKKLLRGVSPEKAVNLGALKNPESIDFFINFRKTKELLQKSM